jgi:predicted nucleic-acid-binding Zn-ribbon protein
MDRRLTGQNHGEGENFSHQPCRPLFWGYNTLMETFRHNLSPVEVKLFLKSAAALTENLAVRYVHKISIPCPRCGYSELCYGAAISYFASSSDKTTHEITVCLHCGYKDLSTLTTCERL